MIIHRTTTGLFGDQRCPYANDLQQLLDNYKTLWENWSQYHTQVLDPASISWQRNKCVVKFTCPVLSSTTPALFEEQCYGLGTLDYTVQSVVYSQFSFYSASVPYTSYC